MKFSLRYRGNPSTRNLKEADQWDTGHIHSGYGWQRIDGEYVSAIEYIRFVITRWEAEHETPL